MQQGQMFLHHLVAAGTDVFASLAMEN